MRGRGGGKGSRWGLARQEAEGWNGIFEVSISHGCNVSLQPGRREASFVPF